MEKNWWNSGNTYYCATSSTTNIMSPDIIYNTLQRESKIIICGTAEQLTGQFYNKNQKPKEWKLISSGYETPDRPQYAQYQTQHYKWHWECHVGYLPSLPHKSQSMRHSRTLYKPSVLKQSRHSFLAHTLWSNDCNWIIKRLLFCTVQQQLGACPQWSYERPGTVPQPLLDPVLNRKSVDR